MVDDPEFVLRSQRQIRVPGVLVLRLYAVLGEYDFVNIVEAPDNDAVARFSLELGVTAGAHVTTMPAIPVSRLERSELDDAIGRLEEESLSPPDE